MLQHNKNKVQTVASPGFGARKGMTVR